eukprot:1676711-Pyramimonas_sp.AAC.1
MRERQSPHRLRWPASMLEPTTLPSVRPAARSLERDHRRGPLMLRPLLRSRRPSLRRRAQRRRKASLRLG